MINVDTCIHARWILPVRPKGEFLENQSVVIDQGKILSILPTLEVNKQFNAKESVELPNHLIMPGLINSHTHTAMNLLRGLADDLPLMEWLNEHIWPAENRWVSKEFVRVGAQLAIAEMIASGTTTFNDMYFFPDVVGHVAKDYGVRAHVGAVIFDFSSAWGAGPDEYFLKAQELVHEFAHEALVTCNIGPHAPYTVSNENLRRTYDFALAHQCRLNIHLHETQHEVNESLKLHNLRPLQRLAQLGVLSKDMIAVHMTALNDEDRRLVKEHGLHVVTCPESNLKLASGYCEVQKLLDQGTNVCIGTDGAASNNDVDMLSEMRTTALLGKMVAHNPEACSALDTIEMATLNGAKALGVADQVGTLEVGKQADIISINFDEIEAMPLYHPISQLVYATSRHQVNDVWVAGRRLLANRKYQTVDRERLTAEVHTWQERLRNTSL